MTDRSIVRLTAVTKRYGRSEAVIDVDLALGRGVVGLLGPNGAGKTTLLKMLATSLAPTSGQISVFGLDPMVAHERLEIRRRLGYVPQEIGLYETFSVFDFVDYIAILKEHAERTARRAEVRQVLQAVDLDDVRSKPIRKLSGGMRRRVALAQSLLGDPDLLVLDEPTVGLDPEQRLRFRQIVSQHANRRCVVLSTHMTEDVEALCERVVVMDSGHVIQVAAQRPDVVAVISVVPLVDGLAGQLERSRELLAGLRSQSRAWDVLPLLVGQPVVNARYLKRVLGWGDMTVTRALDALTERGVLVERSGKRRNRVWEHRGILGVLDDYAEQIRRATIG